VKKEYEEASAKISDEIEKLKLELQVKQQQKNQNVIEEEQKFKEEDMVSRIFNNKKRLLEEIPYKEKVKRRLTNALEKDQQSVLKVDISPFKSKLDIVKRLLPFHLYQYIDDDYDFKKDFEELDKKGEFYIKKSEELKTRYFNTLKKQSKEKVVLPLLLLSDEMQIENLEEDIKERKQAIRNYYLQKELMQKNEQQQQQQQASSTTSAILNPNLINLKDINVNKQ